MKHEQKMHVCTARTSLGCTSKTCSDHAHSILPAASACRVFFLRPHTALPLLAYPMAKVSSLRPPENSPPALRNPTSHRSLTSARASAPAPQRDRAPPRGALGADAARPPDSPVGGQVPFFEFFNNG